METKWKFQPNYYKIDLKFIEYKNDCKIVYLGLN